MTGEAIPEILLDQESPNQRGRAYGESARERIHEILEVYQEIFFCVTGETWKETVQRGAPFVKKANEFAPDLIEEINGVAQGANRSFEDIFLLNARSEILFNPSVLGQECTTLAALPEATGSGDMLLAQNWDWYQAVLNCQVILKIGSWADKPSIVTFTEAGQLSKIGMNSAGIGLVVNNLTSDQPRIGVPWIFLTRRILESSHLAQALGFVLNTDRAHSINFLIGYAAGEAVNLETSPVEASVQWPENGICVHTNHYIETSPYFRDLKPLRDPYLSTYLRLRRARQGLVDKIGGIDVDGVQNILKDHIDKPFSVCIHKNPAVEPIQQIVTCLSIIMNLSQQQIHYTLGNPCRGISRTMKIDW
jgi:isopenicillin-N N-acyltransferase-like protein